MSLQGKFVDAGGTNTYYIEKGEGRNIVLFHGGGPATDCRSTWFRNMDPLGRHFHVVAFDQIGHGQSGMPKEHADFVRLGRVKHAIKFLDALGIQEAILVGHSEGGFISTRIAIEQPKRVSKLVIVTSGSTSPSLGGDRDREWIEASNEAYDNKKFLASEENFMKGCEHFIYNKELLNVDLLRENYRIAKKSGNLQLYLDESARDSADPYEATVRYNTIQEKYIFPYLSEMKVPTLLVWANNDATVPVEKGIRLMEMIPNAEMHIFDKAKHDVMIDRYEQFNKLLISFCTP
jgi:pimeloyl-ACP methyl ester carboxylesterase